MACTHRSRAAVHSCPNSRSLSASETIPKSRCCARGTHSNRSGFSEPLVKRCTAAAFGAGRKTRYDRTVRDALQLKAEGGAFSVLHFDPAAAGILEQIRRELVPHVPDALSAELYNLNVYGRGGHFVPHKDTPRGSDMLGTLVVCLPSQFSNGAFVVKHHGVFQTYDWGDAINDQAEPTRIHWAALFGDVDHQIERVWSGLRVTLTYLIRRGANIGRSAVPPRPRGAEHPRAAKASCLVRRSPVPGQGWDDSPSPAPICTTKTHASSASSDRSPVKPCPL